MVLKVIKSKGSSNSAHVREGGGPPLGGDLGREGDVLGVIFDTVKIREGGERGFLHILRICTRERGGFGLVNF